jgi:predicted nucleotidyltransferase
VIARFAEVCAADDRVLAAFLAGSHARGAADAHSDVDLCLVTTDAAYEEVAGDRAAFVRRLGDPLFLEDFGASFTSFFILADGTEGELSVGAESRFHEIHVGPFRTLLDERGLLVGATFPEREPDPDEQLESARRSVSWFWHELSHFVAAMGRQQLWWAYGQLEALRGHCVNLARLEQRTPAQEEPYEKLDQAISTTALSGLEATFCPMERGAMLRAGRDIVGFYRGIAPRVARAHGLTYPLELERLMSGRLDALPPVPR